jgi:signal transduction histidine kinase
MTEGQGRELDLLSGWLSQTAEIERLSSRFGSLADAVPVGVAVMTRERLLYANSHVPRVTGRSADSLPATPLVRLFPARDVRARVRAAFKRAWSGTAETLGVVPITRDDGSVCDAAVLLRPLPREVEPTLLVVLDDGAGAGWRAARRPEHEDTLRVFGLYLAGLANDLRGPLTAFLGHLTLLTKRSDLPTDLREAFELYRQVTSETLERFGRAMEWGRRVPLVERVDLQAVVNAAVATFETEATPGTVCLELDLEATPAVAGNTDQLQLALENVVRNAWEALMGRDGTIAVTLARRGRQIALVVKDDGPGIPDSILPHVFDAFSSTKSITAGLGLGLAIVKDIVDRHQGQVTIESSSAGTTVTFLFDAVDETVGDGRRAGRKRVMLVEDNVAVHETYRLLLEKSGFEVVSAHDADEALLLITRETVDALVVDVQMAGRDGLALVEALANWHQHLLPRVTLHTAYAYEDRVRTVAERYGIGLLEKPCPFDKLLETVTRLANTPS